MKEQVIPPTAEEERDLFARVAAGDQDARRDLILRNQRLITHVLKRYRAPGLEWEDLCSMGCIGLIKAVDRFDPERGLRFSSFAARCILSVLNTGTRTQRDREAKHRRMLALDQPLRNDGEETLGDMLAAPDARPGGSGGGERRASRAARRGRRAAR